MIRDVEVDPSADTRDEVDLSVYMIRIADTESTSISLSNLYLNHSVNNSCRRGDGNNNISFYVDISPADIDRSC